MQERATEPTVSGIIATFARAAGFLARREVDLAQAELRQKAAQAGLDVGLLAGGGAVAYGGFLAVLVAAGLGLRRLGLPAWLAALVVGLLAAGAGAGLARTGGARLRRTDPVPQRTIETLKEDVAAVTAR